MKLKELPHVIKKAIPYYKDLFFRAKTLADGRFECSFATRYPCLNDDVPTSGFDAHYLYHTAWAARKLAEYRPQLHIDISSSLFFVALTSAMVPIHFYDYRPAAITLSGLTCGHVDICSLPFDDQSVESISSMHVVEHIGLGRYGDPMDPQGNLKAARELTRVLAPGGRLLFVVPTGDRARLCFNAHRIYTYEQVIEMFSSLKLLEFSFISDADRFIPHADPDDVIGSKYGCGCYLFRRV